MLSPLSLGSVKFGAVNPASSRADAGESCAVGGRWRIDVGHDCSLPFFGLRADTKREQASSYPPYVRAACLTRCATIYFSRSKASAVSNISM